MGISSLGSGRKTPPRKTIGAKIMTFEQFSKTVEFLFDLNGLNFCIACPPGDEALSFCKKESDYGTPNAKGAAGSASNALHLLIKSWEYSLGALLREAGLSVDQVNESLGQPYMRVTDHGVKLDNNCLDSKNLLVAVKPLFLEAVTIV